jgi:hypothetical protein
MQRSVMYKPRRWNIVEVHVEPVVATGRWQHLIEHESRW